MSEKIHKITLEESLRKDQRMRDLLSKSFPNQTVQNFNQYEYFQNPALQELVNSTNLIRQSAAIDIYDSLQPFYQSVQSNFQVIVDQINQMSYDFVSSSVLSINESLSNFYNDSYNLLQDVIIEFEEFESTNDINTITDIKCFVDEKKKDNSLSLADKVFLFMSIISILIPTCFSISSDIQSAQTQKSLDTLIQLQQRENELLQQQNELLIDPNN